MFSPEDSNDPKSGDFSLLPKGLVAPVQVKNRGIKKTQKGGSMFDLELTITEGRYKGRKLWTNVMYPFDTKNSDNARSFGKRILVRLIEAEGTFNPEKPESYDYFSQFEDPEELAYEMNLAIDGVNTWVKVGVEEGTGGYQAKNNIMEWGTPSKASNGNKIWGKPHEPAESQTQPAPQSAPAAKPAAASVFGKPAWAGR